MSHVAINLNHLASNDIPLGCDAVTFGLVNGIVRSRYP